MSEESERSNRIRNRIALSALVLTAVSVMGGGVTALVGGGYFFATITQQIGNVGDDVGEIKSDVKTLSREVDRQIEEVDGEIRDLDVRVNRLEFKNELEGPER